MNTAIRAISLQLAGAATALLLSACATLSPLSDVIIPNFSDEDLGNPMAGYTPAGAVGAPVANRGTCLLYTSPSPRDQRGSRMPSSA